MAEPQIERLLAGDPGEASDVRALQGLQDGFQLVDVHSSPFGQPTRVRYSPVPVSPRTPGSHFTTFSSTALGRSTEMARPFQKRTEASMFSLRKFFDSPRPAASMWLCS